MRMRIDAPRDFAQVNFSIDLPEHVQLAPEAGARLLHLCGGSVEAEALERDQAAIGVTGEIDNAHASPGQAPDDLVVHGPRLEVAGAASALLGAGVPSRPMTDTRDLDQLDLAIDSVVARIDTELVTLLKRELISTDEVADLLLDVRTLLVPVQGEAPDPVPT